MACILHVVVADSTEHPRHFMIAISYCMTRKALPAAIAALAVAHQPSLLNWVAHPESAPRDCLKC